MRPVPSEIDRELADARNARSSGNQGRARVCARRAAGAAIAWMQTRFPDFNGEDALQRLRSFSQNMAVPPGVAAAANRLSSRISQDFTYAASEDPIDDALAIVEFARLKMES